MKLDIQPYIGVGIIKLGMSRNDIIANITSSSSEFYKTAETHNPADSFDSLGIHVYYDDKNCCEAIEMFPPAQPTFNELDLFSKTAKEIIDLFNQIDNKTETSLDGITSYKYGIGFYVPNIKSNEQHASIESIIVFKRGYYD